MTGTEFSLLPAVTTVVATVPDSCAFAFDFDEITLTLATPLTNGNYQLVINNGTDANTLLDNCARAIPQNEQVPFTYAVPQPIFADSIGRVGCASDSIKIYFPKRSVVPVSLQMAVTFQFPAQLRLPFYLLPVIVLMGKQNMWW